MRLSELLEALPEPGARHVTDGDPIIRGIRYDSREVASGDLFVALRGENADGHDYLSQAASLGAAALLVDELPESLIDLPPVVVVDDTRRALARIARTFFGSPADELTLVGVTGTNGKTSTTYLVEAILAAAGVATGLIGTVEIRSGDERERAINTTPESLDLQRTLRHMRTRGVDAVAIEVSSHGLALGRVEGCRFRIAAVTNLTQDHLDFHETMDDYGSAKAALFSEHLADGGVAVVNIDDPSAETFLDAARKSGARIVRVTRRAEGEAEVRVERTDVSLHGTRATLALPGRRVELELPLLGDFNVENMAVAAGIALGLDLPDEALRQGVAACPQVPGRMERVTDERAGAPTVLVDYAHTPDAVDKLLAAARPLARGRLIAVFGCGGDRDRAKRPLMAQAVARHADRAIATSDNPRSEDPDAILDDVVVGLAGLAMVAPDELAVSDRGATRIRDRRIAIEVAIDMAGPDDVVVIAGKGHEDYQIIGSEKLPFDDRDEARRALRRRVS
jgi:UDP-N-acetylmuramoyl-L-alanyl-D-glutamate--2,6-diaminopimelate ligase